MPEAKKETFERHKKTLISLTRYLGWNGRNLKTERTQCFSPGPFNLKNNFNY